MQMRAIILVVAIILGGALYRARCLHRLWYGIGEIGVGLLVLFLAEFPQGPTVAVVSGPPPLLAPLNKWVALAAGVYILVRGLDNIDQGFQQRPSWWDAIFRR
jgi:hypothetical protein